MDGLVEASLVTDSILSTGARDDRWLARLRTTPGLLRAGVALAVLLACGLGLLSGVVFAALDSGFTAAGLHDPALSVFWGAYLSTPDETLISGPLAEVADQITATRAELRERHGWIMDTYLLRRERPAE